jgi:hypothetical protein
VHQPASGVVDEDEQSALRTPILEPPVLRAVDLDQLADALSTIAGLVDPSAALLAIRPKAGLKHPNAKRLPADRDAVKLAELLGRQRRAEISVALADQRQRLRLEAGRGLPVAGLTALLGADSDDAATLFRFDAATLFRDDAATLGGGLVSWF